MVERGIETHRSVMGVQGRRSGFRLSPAAGSMVYYCRVMIILLLAERSNFHAVAARSIASGIVIHTSQEAAAPAPGNSNPANGSEVIAGPEYACNFDEYPDLASYPFCDRSLPDFVRAQDLVARLTLEEKLAELVNSAANITRLGVPRYQWWNEALHGVASSPGVDYNGTIHAATSFPQPILTAAAFNLTLWNQIGQVVSTEARAFYNVRQANLTYWTPNINIVRDPRWGRAQETSGEDPLLTGLYATHFVRGMQEGADDTRSDLPGQLRGPRRLKVSACCKHYVAYDLENWQGMDRYHFDAQVTVRDLEDTYNPPFRSCIQDGRASSLMCSYNRVNGVPSCANRDFLTGVVRNLWHLDGYIVSDCGAIVDMHRDTPYAPTSEEAVADALNAGLDVECGSYVRIHGLSAYNQGLVNESTINTALVNQFTVRMRLGMFDGAPRNQTYGLLGPSDVCTEAHQELAVEAARQGMVLLKNEGNSLPLNRSSNLTLAVVGPHANATSQMLGNYHGNPCKYVTPLEGLSQFGVGDSGAIDFAPGCSEAACASEDLVVDAILAATNADAVVILAGLSQTEEREKLDRTSLRLPGHQEGLIQAVAQAAAGKPVVLVILSGGPVDVNFAKQNPNIQSIMWAGYPGQAGGQAIAEVIFGDHNPGGRLPLTWYPEDYTRISMEDMHMRPDPTTGYPGRTYRFYTQPVIYNFGYGLSYSSFVYRFTSGPVIMRIAADQQPFSYPAENSNAVVSDQTSPQGLCTESRFEVRIAVRNVGLRSGRETILVYAIPPGAGNDGTPLNTLVAFEKVHLEEDTESELVFNVDPCKHFASVREDAAYEIKVGVHVLQVGDQYLPVTIMTAAV